LYIFLIEYLYTCIQVLLFDGILIYFDKRKTGNWLISPDVYEIIRVRKAQRDIKELKKQLSEADRDKIAIF
jgi:hypothetical protein